MPLKGKTMTNFELTKEGARESQGQKHLLGFLQENKAEQSQG